MIVDRILDRKDGKPYSAHDFYMDCLGYGRIGDDITRAMDFGTEEEVKRALCKYVVENEYNPLICDYICRINWLGKTDPVIEEAAALAFNAACRAREAEVELDKKLAEATERSETTGGSEINKNDFIKE